VSINLYIDTNIYLTFYHFSNDDLDELKKLIALVNTGSIKLFLPKQTWNEFRRNREVKIKDSLDNLSASKLSKQFPRIATKYPEFEIMKSAIKKFEKSKSELISKIRQDAESKTLLADDIINQLFEKSVILDITEEIMTNSVDRFRRGDPPGKDNSYGDAINWESLLEKVADFEELYFVSDDKDFYSILNTSIFNSFLLREWKESKKSELFFYRKLSDFFKEKYPDIELTSETEKEIIISNLHDANNFYNAKKVVSKLLRYEPYSVEQINQIANAFCDNSQIYWIKDDHIIEDARRSIIENNFKNMDSDILKRYCRVFDFELKD
jgi:hypothetical protein